MNRKMFFDASPDIFKYAYWLRNNMTEPEKLIWEKLRNNKLGFRFKAQHPMLHYIADFYSYALKLVIEIDGPIHKFKKSYDTDRTQNIEDAGNFVMRFTNDEVINNMDKVLADIRKKIEEIKSKNDIRIYKKESTLNSKKYQREIRQLRSHQP